MPDIREIQLHDAAALAHLHTVCFGPSAWTETQIKDSLTLPTTQGWLAMENEPLGFILCQIAAGEAEILTLAVHPARQNQGIGKALLQQALDTARKAGCTKIFLDVATDNIAALVLYEKHGFRRIGLRPGYYLRGTSGEAQRTDAVLLELPL
jgi:ribosomal-protein-alanine N-acetyltransferase